MIFQGEKVVGVRRDNLRIRSYKQVYRGVSRMEHVYGYEEKEFECEWYEKLVEEIEVLDPRDNSISYSDLYILARSWGYTAVHSWYSDGDDEYNEFGAIISPTCAFMSELAQWVAIRVSINMAVIIDTYDPMWHALR